MRSWPLILVGFLVVATPGRAFDIIKSFQSGRSEIELDGTIVERSSDAVEDGIVSVFAIDGTAASREARTAARSTRSQMAANARIDDKSTFSDANYSRVSSESGFRLFVFADPTSPAFRVAAFDFVLPASFLEVTSNAEDRSAELHLELQADITVSSSFFPDLVALSFTASLAASFEDFTLGMSVDGDPALDLEPLRNPVVRDSGGASFLRTVTVEFPFFQGHLDLGRMPAGSTLDIRYHMSVLASGRLAANVGLAGINDPFLLSTDPLPDNPPIVLSLTPVAVPEPGTCVIILSGAAVLLGVRAVSLSGRPRGRTLTSLPTFVAPRDDSGPKTTE